MTSTELLNIWGIEKIDNTPFVNRYFKCFRKEHDDASDQDKKSDFLEVLHHSNGLCLIRVNQESEFYQSTDTIKFNFQVTESLNRLTNKISGKRKRNAQWLDTNSTLFLLNEEEIKVQSPIRGKLLGINKNLERLVNRGENLKEFLGKPEGFIATLLPNKKEQAVVMAGLSEVQNFS